MAYPSNRPDKKPAAVHTPVSDTQYARFVDRVIACREAEDRAKEDTKALYAEIAAAGEDKTAIGLVVRGLRMTNKDRVKAEIRDAAVEDGRARYRRGKASHVRAREGESEVVEKSHNQSTTPNASNSGDITGKSHDLVTTPDHDPETGEILENTEPAPTAPQLSAADAESQPLGTAEGDAGQAALSATQSTAARKDVQATTLNEDRSRPATLEPAGEGRLRTASGNTQETGTAKSGAEENAVAPASSRLVSSLQPAGTQAQPVDTQFPRIPHMGTVRA